MTATPTAPSRSCRSWNRKATSYDGSRTGRRATRYDGGGTGRRATRYDGSETAGKRPAMTDQQEQAIPTQAAPPAPGPWADYLTAAQRLDAVRRAASTAAGEQQAASAAARQELSAVRA